nr:diguanylate cyclase [Desulfatitalea alkaliphila]
MALQEKATILVVDDQRSNLMVLSKLLKDDYRVLVANNGAKALALSTGDHPPVLVLLDIEMPGIDGYEVCRRLKANEKANAIAVIFVTARDAAEDEEKGLRLGAVDYISKPFHPAIVRARVRNHIELKIKTDLLESLSNQDGLTRIPNRRHFEDRIQAEWSRANRGDKCLSVIMMDIDHFKSYNDHYGHGAGDDCLRRVAMLLKTTLKRPMDMVARYGGEEFVALLPDTDPNGARYVAEQMRSMVEAAAIPHDQSPTQPVVTLSCGVASSGGQSPKSDVAALLQCADQALYRAKQQGRNLVHACTT